MSNPIRRTAAAALLTLAAASSPFTREAPAQVSGSVSYGSWSADTFRPQISRGEIDVLSRILKLTPADRASLVSLFEAHDAEVRAEGSTVRGRCREYSEEAELLQRQAFQTRVGEELKKWEARKKALEEQFLSDLTAMLTKEQTALWPIVERELRRPRALANSWMSGEGIDVVALLASIDAAAAERPEVVELLERYATEIDSALAERDRFVKAHDSEMGDLVSSDPEKALSYRKDSVRNRVRVREINRRFVQQIAPLLAETSRRKFLDQYLSRCVLWWNRETPGERFIRAAAKVDGLGQEGRDKAAGYLKEYTGAVEDLTRRTVAEYQAWEEKRVPEQIALALGTITEEQARGNTLSDAPDDSPLGKVRLERLRLDREYRSKMRALLSPEQKASIDEGQEDGTRFFCLDDSARL